MFKLFESIYQGTKLNQWLNTLSISLFFMLIIRGFEWVLISSTHSISDDIAFWQLEGLLHDFFVVVLLVSLVGVIFYILSFIHIKIARFVGLSVILSLLIFHLLLVVYFKESLTPLTVSDIYGMSQIQVEFISEIYGFKMIYLFGLIPVVLVLMVVFNLLSLAFNKSFIRYVSIGITCISLVNQLVFPVKETAFDSELNYHIVGNKLFLFGNSWIVYHNDKLLNSNDFTPKKEYPLFNESEVKDVLSPFFNESEKPPNIVYIISESLGKQYSGKNARLGSFTPFLDSLAEHSLYWENVVANAERTFGAIPNLMAGLPEGQRGFMNLRWNMPDHLSLPLLLKENNNYQTAFFCGAWKYFDNMADYIMFQKFDYVLGKADFKENVIQHKNREGEDQFIMKNWGAEDVKVFEESVEFMKINYDTLKPFLNLYLSTSFHQPYAYTNQKGFEKKALKFIESNVNPTDRSDYLKHQKDFAAILYADYSMQQVFEMYKKANLFDNTIFIIVGDHSLKFMNDNPRLEKFHIPLLIYSPLLDRSKYCKSLVCQKDVPSALQALLKNKYNLKLPSFSISQTNNLDTLTKFSYTNTDFAMMYSNKRLTTYIENNVMLSDNILFKISDKLNIKRINDETNLVKLQDKLKYYKQINNYVCANNKYLPKSIIDEFSVVNYQKNDFFNFTFFTPKILEKHTVSIKNYFSKPKSIEVKNTTFITLLDNQKLNLTKRVRLVIKVKIYSPSGYIPTLVVSLTEKGKRIEDKVFYIYKNDDNLKETTKDGWKTIEVAYWVDKGTDKTIGAYLFNAEKANLFLDDLQIEIREF